MSNDRKPVISSGLTTRKTLTWSNPRNSDLERRPPIHKVSKTAEQYKHQARNNSNRNTETILQRNIRITTNWDKLNTHKYNLPPYILKQLKSIYIKDHIDNGVEDAKKNFLRNVTLNAWTTDIKTSTENS